MLRWKFPHGRALRAGGLHFSWHTSMASKRKSAVTDEARGDDAETFQRQRVRTDFAGADIPAMPPEVQLPPRHDGRSSVEGGAIAVSCAAALIAWVTAVAQRQGYSRAAGALMYHLPLGGCLAGLGAGARGTSTLQPGLVGGLRLKRQLREEGVEVEALLQALQAGCPPQAGLLTAVLAMRKPMGRCRGPGFGVFPAQLVE